MQEMLDFLKIIADETRLRIILMLSRRDMCVCRIMDRLQMSQPAVSHHLRILRKGGLVRDEKDGRWIFYSLHKDAFFAAAENLNLRLVDQVRKNLAEGKTGRDYDACARIESGMRTVKMPVGGNRR